MDPNSFSVNWEQTSEVLGMIVVLAFLVERSLALLFESSFYVKRFSDSNIKELIAFVVCFGVCLYWKVDALSVILHGDKINPLGQAITAGVIAGGSKASLKLFRDVMGIESTASKEQQIKKSKPTTPPVQEKADAAGAN